MQQPVHNSLDQGLRSLDHLKGKTLSTYIKHIYVGTKAGLLFLVYPNIKSDMLISRRKKLRQLCTLNRGPMTGSTLFSLIGPLG